MEGVCEMRGEKEYRCLQCGFEISSLFVQYSPGNIRLENCRGAVDEYIECEIMILLIDLILHKLQAYRHLLRITLFRNNSNSQICLDVLLGNLIFLCTFYLATRKILNISVGTHSYKDLFLAIIISSYFKMFLITMMVWEFPSTVIYISDIFVISSNAVAVKGTCFCAHAAKFLITQLLHYKGGAYIKQPEVIQRWLSSSIKSIRVWRFVQRWHAERTIDALRSRVSNSSI